MQLKPIAIIGIPVRVIEDDRRFRLGLVPLLDRPIIQVSRSLRTG